MLGEIWRQQKIKEITLVSGGENKIYYQNPKSANDRGRGQQRPNGDGNKREFDVLNDARVRQWRYREEWWQLHPSRSCPCAMLSYCRPPGCLLWIEDSRWTQTTSKIIEFDAHCFTLCIQEYISDDVAIMMSSNMIFPFLHLLRAVRLTNTPLKNTFRSVSSYWTLHVIYWTVKSNKNR